MNTPSVKRQRQRQGPIGMHCDAPTQASKLQSAAAADAWCGHLLSLDVVLYDLMSILHCNQLHIAHFWYSLSCVQIVKVFNSQLMKIDSSTSFTRTGVATCVCTTPVCLFIEIAPERNTYWCLHPDCVHDLNNMCAMISSFGFEFQSHLISL